MPCNQSALTARVPHLKTAERHLAAGWIRLACAMSAAIWLGACGSPPLTQTRYDLGTPPAMPAQPRSNADAAVIVPDVTASEDLDTDHIRFRFAYLNDQQTGGYATSRWTMTPAQMLTQQLRAKLASTGPVLANPGTYAAPTLRVELTRFEQVFTQPAQGQGVVNLRATLTRDGQLIGQRDFYATAPAPTPDAAGGVQALSRASDAALDALIVWYETEPRQ